MGAFVLRNEAGDGLCPGLPARENLINTATIGIENSGMRVGWELYPEGEVRTWPGTLPGVSLTEARDFDRLWEEVGGGSVAVDFTPIDDVDANQVEVVFRERSKRVRYDGDRVTINFELLEAK